jgi:hypothetical protein
VLLMPKGLENMRVDGLINLGVNTSHFKLRGDTMDL